MITKKRERRRTRGPIDIAFEDDKQQLNLMRKIRGQYLGEATEVENKVSNLIAIHFFPHFLDGDERYRQLQNTILEHRSFTFSAKAEALQYLLKQSHRDLYEKYKGTLTKLQKLIEHRNMLAHGYFIQELKMPKFMEAQLDRPKQVMVETFHKGEVVPHFITTAEADLKLREAEQISTSLGKLWFEIMKRGEEQAAPSEEP